MRNVPEMSRKCPKTFLVGTLALGLALTACQTARPVAPRVVYQEVRTAVPVPCNPQLRPEPNYPDTDEALAAEPDVLAGVRDLRIGREMRIARIAELNGAINACRQPAGR